MTILAGTNLTLLFQRAYSSLTFFAVYLGKFKVAQSTYIITCCTAVLTAEIAYTDTKMFTNVSSRCCLNNLVAEVL